jgi:hypothetical protein
MKPSRHLSVFLFPLWFILTVGMLSSPLVAESTAQEESPEVNVDLTQPREWTSIQGRTITAVLVSRSGGMIRLKEVETDRVYTMLLAQLVPEHRKLIEEHTEP